MNLLIIGLVKVSSRLMVIEMMNVVLIRLVVMNMWICRIGISFG